MFCIKKITNDLTWVGGNDRRLAMFEGVYSVPNGVSYNSYLLLDDSTVLFDTVDSAVSKVFFENIEHVLNGRDLDYVIVQHMEPDHSATLGTLLTLYPNTKIVCNNKIATMIKQYFNIEIDNRTQIVDETSVLKTGKHELHFVMAPMVHWPEVMVTFDSADKILFSADAFGTFGALNGAIFADEVDFDRDYLDEARRYYCNIVGKYGLQVQALLKKAATLDIKMICPLHGFVWRNNLGDFIEKYDKWSSYTPEYAGVMIAYASVYGNTENAAEILSSKLRDKGIKTVMYDVSVTPASEIISAAFMWSHIVFASTTYNAGIFVSMDELLRDLAAHNIQNRTVAFMENGSWAPTSGRLMKEILMSCKNMTILDKQISIKSSLAENQLADIDELVELIAETFPKVVDENVQVINANALQKISYGLYVLTSNNGEKDNGCIINTVSQVTSDNPLKLTITVNKDNYTHEMIMNTREFNISILTEEVPFDIFKQFGFVSGRGVDKFENFNDVARSENGILYLIKYTNAVISCKVIETYDYGTHTIFVADITESKILSHKPSVTYEYYFEHIKPNSKAQEKKKGYVCKICGYVYEGEELPTDFICPLCKHGVEAFEKIQ